jgi:hypothetical protein
MSLIKINSAFDGGNIEVVKAEDPQNIQLNIRKDTNAAYFQWFYFRIQEVQGMDLKIDILNASEASFPKLGKVTKRWSPMIDLVGLELQLLMIMKNLPFLFYRSLIVCLWPILRPIHTNSI